MWVRTEGGNLVNLANCTAVKKHRVNTRPSDGEWLFSVMAIDASPEATYALAKGLEERDADDLLAVLYERITADKGWTDVRYEVKRLREKRQPVAT